MMKDVWKQAAHTFPPATPPRSGCRFIAGEATDIGWEGLDLLVHKSLHNLRMSGWWQWSSLKLISPPPHHRHTKKCMLPSHIFRSGRWVIRELQSHQMSSESSEVLIRWSVDDWIVCYCMPAMQPQWRQTKKGLYQPGASFQKSAPTTFVANNGFLGNIADRLF